MINSKSNMAVEQGDIQFRPCKPDDVAELVPLIISSGPATFDYIFADTELSQVDEFVERSYVQGKMEMGYPTHTALLLEGKVVGAGGLWHSGFNLQFLFWGAQQILSYYGLIRGAKVIRRALQLESVVKPPRSGVAYVGHVGVSPEQRGKGFGSMLMQELILQAKNLEYSKCGLDVSARNPKAQKLYEHLGFKVIEVNPANYQRKFGDVIEHRYMELEL